MTLLWGAATNVDTRLSASILQRVQSLVQREGVLLRYSSSVLMIVGLLCCVSNAAVAQTTGLVAYWPLDVDASDVTSNGSDGAISGAQPVSGVVDGAHSFDGLDDEVVIVSPSAPLKNSVAGPHSMAMWVRLSEVPSVPKFVLDGVTVGLDQQGVRFEWNAKPIFKWVTSSGSFRAYAATTLTVGTWAHIVGVFDGMEGRIYVNGQLDGTTASSGVAAAANIWKIGNVSGGGTGDGFFPGLIDDVRVYNRALLPEEIVTLYTGRPTLSCVGFDPPLHNGPVTVRNNNRALPLKAGLEDDNGISYSDIQLQAPPVIQVWFTPGSGGAIDVTDDALPAGFGTDGNEFEFNGTGWQFNLKLRNYSAAGTYTVTLESGDDTEYLVDPACMAEFVIN